MVNKILILVIVLLQLWSSFAIVENRWSQFRAGVTFHGCTRIEGAFDIARGLTFGPDFKAAHVPTNPRVAFNPKQRELDPTIWIQVCDPDPNDVNQYYKETFRFDGANGGIAAVGYKLLTPISNNQTAIDACNADWIISPWGDWHGNPQYIRGHNGIKGDKGEPGVQGSTGPQGPTGVNGTPGINGQKGCKGVAGFPGAPGIRGVDGATGPTGPIGTIGTQGPTGASGCVGIVGQPGAQGSTGPTGARGDTGSSGPTGVTGPVGNPGAIGLSGPQGLQGPLGPQGAVGATGPQGAIGFQGTQGLTGPTGNIGTTGTPGFTGATGLVGVTGPTGLQGPLGAQGPTGPSGSIGFTGSQGFTGPQGTFGPDGINGPTGPQGNNGTTGIRGPLGPVGPAGAPGLQGFNGVNGSICLENPYYFLYRNPIYTASYSDSNPSVASQQGYIETGFYTINITIFDGTILTNLTREAYSPMCTRYCDRILFAGFANWNKNFLNSPSSLSTARTLDLRYRPSVDGAYNQEISSYVNNYYWVLPNIARTGAELVSNPPGDKSAIFANRNFICPPPQLVIGFITSFIPRSSADADNIQNRCLAFIRIDFQGRVHTYRVGTCTPTFSNGGVFDFFSHLDFNGLNYVPGYGTLSLQGGGDADYRDSVLTAITDNNQMVLN